MTAPIDLYLQERRQAIIDVLAQQGRAAVADLSTQFGVSEVTIRSDLQALAEQGLILRTHGGAVLNPESGQDHLALNQRQRRKVAEKARIGAAGAALIDDGAAVFLDSSSTSLAIAHQLKQHRHLTVLTNSLAVAQELLDAPGVNVVMTGGVLQKETASLVGTAGLAWLEQYNIQLGFFGAHGITADAGLTDVSLEQAEVKRPIVRLCRRVVAVLDSTKWGQVGIASFAHVADLQTIITDDAAPAADIAALKRLGIDIRIA
jgi:DeoR family transcriptional regulator of aga operon/DeoR family fructose operon transcriptional repressor